MPPQVDKARYARRPAWHRDGDVDEDYFDSKAALRSLDESGEGVIKADVTLTFVDSKGVEHKIDVPQKMGLVDFDSANQDWRFQSIMDKDYGLVQLQDMFLFMDTVIGLVDGAHYDAAVRLRGGTQTVLSAYLGDYVLDPKGREDRNSRYLWGFNSLNGSWALRLKKGEYRIECANMAAMALRGSTDEVRIGTDWTTRHTKNVMERVEEAKQALQMWNRHDRLFQAQAEHMIQTPIGDGAVDRIVTTIYTDINPKTGQSEADKEAIEKVKTVLELGKTTINIRDTVWGAFNAVTEHEDWMVKVRGGKNATVSEARMVRQITDPDDRKQRAWDLMWDYATDTNPKFKMPDLA